MQFYRPKWINHSGRDNTAIAKQKVVPQAAEKSSQITFLFSSLTSSTLQVPSTPMGLPYDTSLSSYPFPKT